MWLYIDDSTRFEINLKIMQEIVNLKPQTCLASCDVRGIFELLIDEKFSLKICIAILNKFSIKHFPSTFHSSFNSALSLFKHLTRGISGFASCMCAHITLDMETQQLALGRMENPLKKVYPPHHR